MQNINSNMDSNNSGEQPKCIKRRKVFVSYSRTDYINQDGVIIDDSKVNHILLALRNTDLLDVWVDVKAKYSGQYFTNVLAKRIIWSDILLFLSSSNSNTSEWVSKEILFAAQNKKKIIVVRLDDSSYNLDFAIILAGKDYIDFNKESPEKLNDIIENIIQAEDCHIPEIDIETHDSKYMNSTIEQKGSLNLNINMKGCALSMTILMFTAFLIGFFYLFKNLEPHNVLSNSDADSICVNKNKLEHAKDYLAEKTSSFQINKKDSNRKKNGIVKKQIINEMILLPHSQAISIDKDTNDYDIIEDAEFDIAISNKENPNNANNPPKILAEEPTETDADDAKYKFIKSKPYFYELFEDKDEADKQWVAFIENPWDKKWDNIKLSINEAKKYEESKKMLYELFEDKDEADEIWRAFICNPSDKRWAGVKIFLENPLIISKATKEQIKETTREMAKLKTKVKTY